MHGVVGQQRHGYFEASPNHDAVALGVVNDTLAEKIVGKIKSLGALIRPNVFILPNTDCQGKASAAGSGAVGYDDMACGNGTKCGGIFGFGTWVNGGVWTTTEGRWLMAAARMGDLTPAFDSMRQMQKLFGATWRMDNPIVNFGLAPYQPDEDINLTVRPPATIHRASLRVSLSLSVASSLDGAGRQFRHGWWVATRAVQLPLHRDVAAAHAARAGHDHTAAPEVRRPLGAVCTAALDERRAFFRCLLRRYFFLGTVKFLIRIGIL